MPARAASARLDDVTTQRASSLRHVRPVQPLRFPASEPEWEKMPESRRHARLCKALFEMLRSLCCPESTVGWDQFVYYDATDPRRKLAPDGFVKLSVPDHDFDSYLVWEEGTPELAFEILSPSDTPERWTFKEKLRRYHALGVRELIVANVDAKPGKRLRAWDRIQHDLVERVVTGDRTPCLTLGVTARIGHVDVYPVALRIARDEAGRSPRPHRRRGARPGARRGRRRPRRSRRRPRRGRRRPRRGRQADRGARAGAPPGRRAGEALSTTRRRLARGRGTRAEDAQGAAEAATALSAANVPTRLARAAVSSARGRPRRATGSSPCRAPAARGPACEARASRARCTCARPPRWRR